MLNHLTKLLFRALGVFCVARIGLTSLHAAETPTRGILIERVLIHSYVSGHRAFSIRAARGYAGTKRWGFLQTALVPTVELEDVVIERVHDDGTIESIHLPVAIIDWNTKSLYSPSGKSLLHIQ